MTMLAFTNTEVTKSQLLASLESHAKADAIISGTYGKFVGNKFKGCAVGCSIHDFRPGSESNHALYEPLFGVPRAIARLEDSIFERLPAEERKAWPIKFASAINEGSDLSGVWDRFALWLLIDGDAGVIKFARTDGQRLAIQGVADLYRRKISGDVPKKEEWLAYANAANAAYANAYAAVAAYAAAANAYDAVGGAYAAVAADGVGVGGGKLQSEKLVAILKECMPLV